jgi:release factor glutamine methyltransferase
MSAFSSFEPVSSEPASPGLGSSVPALDGPAPDIVARLRAAGCVFAEDEAALLVATARTPDELAAMVEHRVSGRPLEHVLGWAEFCGLRLVVEPGVFVPRPRTAFLIEQALALVREMPVTPVVLDLCCGTGAMGAAVAAGLGRPVELHAADLDPAAVRCARRNLPDGHVYEGDLYEPLPATLRRRVDVLIASPPYVPSASIGLLPPEARLYEPLVALDGGDDGLAVVRRVIAQAPEWLAPGGHLLVETSERQADATVRAVEQAGLAASATGSDELDATAVIGVRRR